MSWLTLTGPINDFRMCNVSFVENKKGLNFSTVWFSHT